jgi:hypothetical protein
MKYPKLTDQVVYDRTKSCGFILLEQYIGSDKKHLIKCINCGIIKSFSLHAIWSYHTKCKCASTNSNHGNWVGYKNISGSMWYHILRNSKRNSAGLKCEFNITKEYLWQLYRIQNKRCALSGLSISFPLKSEDKHDLSLDRINSNRGYIKGNVQWLNTKINSMKWGFSLSYFLSMLKLVKDPLTSSSNILGIYGIPLRHANGWNGYYNISGNLIYTWKKSAKRRNIDYSISIEDIWNLYIKQNGNCALTGLPIFF